MLLIISKFASICASKAKPTTVTEWESNRWPITQHGYIDRPFIIYHSYRFPTLPLSTSFTTLLLSPTQYYSLSGTISFFDLGGSEKQPQFYF